MYVCVYICKCVCAHVCICAHVHVCVCLVCGHYEEGTWIQFIQRVPWHFVGRRLGHADSYLGDQSLSGALAD